MDVRLCSEGAFAVALAVLLGLFKIPLPHLLYGGTVSLEALPILVVGFRRGGRVGAVAGALYGVVDFLLYPVIVHPLQVGLDYPVAFGLLGGVGGGVGHRSIGHSGQRTRLWIAAGILCGNSARFLAHFLSGIVFFASYAPEGQPVWLYSLLYNASYIIPQCIIHILLLQIVLRLIFSKLS